MCSGDIPAIIGGSVNSTAGPGNIPRANCTISGVSEGDPIIITSVTALPQNLSIVAANISAGGNLTLLFASRAIGASAYFDDLSNWTVSYIAFLNATG